MGDAIEVEVDGRVIRISNPDRIYFPQINATKHDLVDYYLAVGPGIVNALYERPCMLHRFPKGVLGEPGEKVHQKRIPSGAPDWMIEGWISTYVAIAEGSLDLVSGDVETVTGRQPMTLEQTLDAHPQLLSGDLPG